jgi:hypothetical protein
LIPEHPVHARSDGADFPCPFCGSSAILLIGGSLIFLYYRCGSCWEIWTVTAPPEQVDRWDQPQFPAIETVH